MNNKLSEIIKILEKYDQTHLLKFFDDLSIDEKEVLINQIKIIDFEYINKLYNETLIKKEIKTSQISPIKYYVKKELDQDYYKSIGEKILKENKLAVITLAGGMGSRLGLTSAKGTFEVNINGKKLSLFEVICNKLKEVNKKYNSIINWYIMTSPANSKLAKDFFIEKNYFGYPKEKIIFFTQSTEYIIDTNGKLMLEDKGIIKKGSNGNGDVYKSFKDNNLNESLKGIDWISISGIDNILLDIIDPVFIGLASEKNYDISAKSIAKEDLDNDKEWVYAKVDDLPSIINPIYLTKEMKYSKNENGKYEYNQFNILSHLYKKDIFLKCEDVFLPYHMAYRKTSYLDENGIKVEATEPNSYKPEKFIYDAFSYFKNFMLLEVEKDKEFSPIKEKEDVKKAEELYEKKLVDND